LPDTDVLLAHVDVGAGKILFQRKYESVVGKIPAGPGWMLTKEEMRKRLLFAWEDLPNREKTGRISEATQRARSAGEVVTLDWIFGPSLEVLAKGTLWDFTPKTDVKWLKDNFQALDRFALFIEATRSAHVARLEEKRGGPFSGPLREGEARVEQEIWQEIFGEGWEERFDRFSRALGGPTENPFWPRERMEAFRTGEKPISKPGDPALRKLVLESLRNPANTKEARESGGFLPYFVEVVPPEKNSLLRLENSAERRPPSSVRKKMTVAFEELYLKNWWIPASQERGIFSPSVTKEIEHLIELGLVPSKKYLGMWAETKLRTALLGKPSDTMRILDEYVETMTSFRERSKAIQSASNIILGKDPKRKGLHFFSKTDKTGLTHSEARVATLFYLRKRPKGFAKRVNKILRDIKPDIEKGVAFLLGTRVKDAATEFFGEQYLREREPGMTLIDLWSSPPFFSHLITPEGMTILPEGALDQLWIGWFSRNRNNKNRAHMIVGAIVYWDRKSLSGMRRLPFTRDRAAELLKDQKETVFQYYSLVRLDFSIEEAKQGKEVNTEVVLAVPNLNFPIEMAGNPDQISQAAMQEFVKTGIVKAAHEASCFDDFLCK
jgi:hypothetical protein